MLTAAEFRALPSPLRDYIRAVLHEHRQGQPGVVDARTYWEWTPATSDHPAED